MFIGSMVLSRKLLANPALVCIPWATGDGLLMAREAGAMLVSMGGMTALHIATVSTEGPATENPVRGLPYCLGINKNGQRYVDAVARS